MNLPGRQIMIAELGLEAFPVSAQDEILAEVGQTVYLSVLVAILGALPEDVKESFRTLTDEGRGDEAEALASKHIEHLPSFVAEEAQKALAKFKDTYASLAQR